jgi:hypothetical protein
MVEVIVYVCLACSLGFVFGLGVGLHVNEGEEDNYASRK